MSSARNAFPQTLLQVRPAADRRGSPAGRFFYCRHSCSALETAGDPRSAGHKKALGTAIRAEEDRTGIRDPAHVAYPAVAKEEITRGDTLLNASAALKRRLADARGALDRALAGRGVV
jgi:hypothetical protein